MPKRITAWKVSVFGVFMFRIQSECTKIRTRKTPNIDTFYSVNDFDYYQYFTTTIKKVIRSCTINMFVWTNNNCQDINIIIAGIARNIGFTIYFDSVSIVIFLVTDRCIIFMYRFSCESILVKTKTINYLYLKVFCCFYKLLCEHIYFR